jgi:hypothetical protein
LEWWPRRPLTRSAVVKAQFAALARPSHGLILLGVVAAGMVAFAAYSVADARYRRV